MAVGGDSLIQMIEAYPFVPMFGSVRIGMAIFRYLGGLNFGVTGDYDSAPDIEVLCDGIEAGVAEYLVIASVMARGNGTPTKGGELHARHPPARRKVATKN